MSDYHATFSSGYENVAVARHAVVTFAEHWFSGEALDDIECAVGEALANSAEHGSKSGGSVDVTCDVKDGALVIEVKDTGAGFERWNAVDYVRPMHNAARGYGMFIMRELMDEVEYSEHGTRLRLIKELPQR